MKNHKQIKERGGFDRIVYRRPIIEYMEKMRNEGIEITRELLLDFIAETYNIKHPYRLFRSLINLGYVVEYKRNKRVVELIDKGKTCE